MSDDVDRAVLDRLDLLLGVVQLAYAEQIGTARAKLRSDPVVAGILDASDDWIKAGELVTQVVTESGASKRTVQRRVSELITSRALGVQGAGSAISYRSTGLV
jgi:hypothetical protein